MGFCPLQLRSLLSVLALGLVVLPAGAQAADPVAAPDLQWTGAATYDYAGSSVADAGDVDGDGAGDALVHSMYSDANGRSDSGSLFVVPGRTRNATAATLGSEGMRIDGPLAWGQFGYDVAGAGDVNGDGRDDVVITSREADHNGRANSGSAWVVFGVPGAATVDVANLGAGGFRIDGAAAHDRLGYSAAGVGDLNGDGLADLALGALGADNNSRSTSGSVYVVFGRTGTANVDLAALGAGGFRIDGAAAGDNVGAVGRLDDVTGDGRAEILVGANAANPAGRVDAGSAYVVPGQAAAANLDLSSSSSYLTRVDGASSSDRLGIAVGRGGDPDADGRPDLMVGAHGTDPSGRSGAGSVYVLPANAGRTIDLATELPGWRIDAPGSGDNMGFAFDGGRDINGDGTHDVVVGNPRDDRNGRGYSGSSYVLFGGARAQVTDLATSVGGGFRTDGALRNDRAGASVALLPDLSGDGRADLLHGVPNADTAERWDTGAAWVVHGFRPGRVDYPATIEATVSQTLGPVAPEVERTGSARFSVSPPLPVGVTLDPVTGVVAGTPVTVSREDSQHVVTMSDLSGAVEVSFTLRVDPLPGACANEQPGTEGPDRLVGSRGGDLIAAAAGEDVVDGAGGDDCISGASADDHLEGGAGADRVEGGDESDSLSGGAGDDALLGEAGIDALDGGEGSDLLDGGDRNDRLDGGAGADRLLGGPALDELFGGDGDDEIHGGEERDTVAGGAGADLLYGDGAHDRLAGEDGDDALWGADGSDDLDGGAGNDRIAGEHGWDILVGGHGDDQLDGGSDGDRLHGGEGADVLQAGAGADLVADTSGASHIDAGAGKDRVEVRNRKRDVVNCGSGRDTVVADRKDKLRGCERRSRR